MGRLQDKVSIVTGASSGIGRAVALEFAQQGAIVVCANRVPEARKEIPTEREINTHDLITQNGGRSIFVKTDITKPEDIEGLISRTVADFGRIDILINNAGISLETRRQPLKIHETSLEDFDRTMEVNVRSIFLTCKHVIAQMLKQEPNDAGDRGWIINMSSIIGLVGGYNLTCYSASKGAITNMTRTIALDYGSLGIHCNAICPGYAHTAIFENTLSNMEVDLGAVRDLHPLKGIGKPQDIVGAAVFLASEEAGWVTGINLPVDGGYTCR